MQTARDDDNYQPIPGLKEEDIDYIFKETLKLPFKDSSQSWEQASTKQDHHHEPETLTDQLWAEFNSDEQIPKIEKVFRALSVMADRVDELRKEFDQFKAEIVQRYDLMVQDGLDVERRLEGLENHFTEFSYYVPRPPKPPYRLIQGVTPEQNQLQPNKSQRRGWRTWVVNGLLTIAVLAPWGFTFVGIIYIFGKITGIIH
jgi:hypothetical protein